MSAILNCTNYSADIPNIIKSDGIYLIDETGKRYMDLESGVWCTALGHNNLQINKVIQQQSETLMHSGFCYSNEIVERAGQSVLSISNLEKGKCVFLCSGSEAIELARQIAKHTTGRKRSMTLHDSYLGSYSSVIDKSRDWYLFNWDECNECPDHSNCDPSCQKIKDIPDDIADFIFEPGSSSGFVRFPPVSLIHNIINKAKALGAKIIANEVTTGIGRTGKWFGHNHYEIKPDMIAIGKGIGNGYPVSVTVINEQTARELEKSTFRYMQSHQNDPMGAAIVHEVVKIIKENNLISKAEEKGNVFLKQLKPLNDYSAITDTRGRGLMFAMDVHDRKTGQQIYSELLDNGYIICNRESLFRIDPPLIIDENQFMQFIYDFRRVLEKYNS